jgi:chloramphenicol-sensitive protein RarD
MTGATEDEARSSLRLGLLLGVSAYALWGLFPLYWPLLEPASPLEILADRFLFSLIFMAILLTVTRTWLRLAPIVRDRRAMALLGLATTFITVNWGVYIWAVNNQHVVEASLGYFINPLVLVVVGTLSLHERLRPLQWTAVTVAAVASLVLTAGYGRVPWVALLIAGSWAGYGIVKKLAHVDPLGSLTVETAYASPFALAYLVWLGTQGSLVFGHSSATTTLLLAGSGVVTAIPLLLFGGAANRVPLSTLGVLQYLTPVIQFVIGVWLRGEQMPPARWVGFGFVWVALAVFSYDSLRQGRANRAARRAADLDEVEAPV